MEHIRLIAVMIFSLAVTASAHALTPAPISVPEPDDMITQVAVGCGPGRIASMAYAWLERPSATPAVSHVVVCGGREALARCTNETKKNGVRITDRTP